jgi:hypothetical protein
VDMASTVAPSILGWDGTRGGRNRNGDPDNSALTGASNSPFISKTLLSFTIIFNFLLIHSTMKQVIKTLK